MTAIKLEKFGGMLPAWDDHLLPDGQAALAVNGYLFSGALNGWRQPKLLRALQNGAAKFAFRLPTVTKATATAVLTLITTPLEGDYVTVGEENYTFTATVNSSYDVLIGADAPTSAANLFAALTLGIGEGLLYGAGTVANPAVSIITSDNVLSNNVITVAAPDYGAAYNSTVVSESTSGVRLSWNAATFTGGANESSDNTITGPSSWIEFFDANTTVMKSPVVGDTYERYFSMSPSLPPQYNTRARIDAGKPWWLLGVNPPGCAPGIDITGGGTSATLGFPNANVGGTLYTLPPNMAYLTPITPDGATSLNDISFNVSAAGAGINFVGLLYSDNSGIPGTIMVSGDIVNGVALGTNVATFANPPGLLAGTQYWVGIVADTALSLITGGTDSNYTDGGVAEGTAIGYTFSTPFTSISGAATPTTTPVLVTDASFSYATAWNNGYIDIDTPISAQLDIYTTLLFGSTTQLVKSGYWAEVAETAPIGATRIRVTWYNGAVLPAAGTQVNCANSAVFVGASTVSSNPPASNVANVQLWADLTTSSVLEARAYVYTYVTEYSEESAPSPPTLVTGWSNGVWTISLFQPPSDDRGVTRDIQSVNIYRTVSGVTGQTVYYFVASVPVGTDSYTDTITDDIVALNNQLPSTNWFPPPAGLQGLLAMPNGMAVAFKGNEIWFCEPYRPHAWPPGYVLTTEFPIVGLGVVGQSVVACTTSQPSVATGSSPSVMVASQIKYAAPCMSFGSVLSTSDSVFYSSPNGLISVNPAGTAANTTELWITRERWKSLTPQKNLRAILQASCYFAFGSVEGSDNSVAQTGFTIELATADAQSFTIWPQPGGHRIGFNQLVSPNGYDVDNVLLDPWTGVGMLIQNGGIYYYDFTDQAPTCSTYTWRSKVYQQKAKANFEAMKVFFSIPAGTPAQSATRNEAPASDASWQTLAAGQYGIVRWFADGALVCAREIRKSGELLRGLSGFKAEEWQWEITARVPISNVQVATSSKELSNV